MALPHADAYLLQICRPAEEQQWSVPKEGTAGAAGVTATDADFHPLLGVEVELCDLSNAAYNGLKGKVMSWHADKGRAGVHVTSLGKVLAVKPQNMMAVELGWLDDFGD